MKYKSIDAQLLALMMRNHKLIAQKRARGFSTEAIVKVIIAKENSKR